MNSLSSTDLSLLSKLLGMVGSAHDAEALAAARKAHELVKAKGRTWPEVLGLDDAPPPEADHIALARELLGRGKAICTPWEMRFLRGVLGFKILSAQQRQSLDGIAAKVEAASTGMATDPLTD